MHQKKDSLQACFKSEPLRNLNNQNNSNSMKKSLLLLGLFGALLTTKAQTLDVISYNIRYDNPNDAPNNWDNRKDFLISQLNFYHPDVFGTQEGLVHQLKDMDQGLEDYAYFGIGRDHGDERGEFTAIFYDKKKKILEK